MFPRFFILSSVPILLFSLLLLGFLTIINLKVEIHSVLIIFLILLIFLFFVPHNAWCSFSLFKKNIEEVIYEVDEFLLSNELVIGNKKKSYGNIDVFFDEYVKKIRNDNFANVATSIFPTLGILGTFTAIAISMPNFTVESKEALETEITILLSGVGTAFYASIYGIFLSIWWVFFEKRGVTKIMNEVDAIKNQYQEQLWSQEEIELYKILDLQDQNRRFLEKIENVVTPEYVYKMDEIVQSKLALMEKVNHEFHVSQSALTQSYNQLTSLFMDAHNKHHQLVENFEKLQALHQKMYDNINLSQEEQIKHSKAIKAEIYSTLSSFELVSSDLRSLGKDLLKNSKE